MVLHGNSEVIDHGAAPFPTATVAEGARCAYPYRSVAKQQIELARIANHALEVET